MVGDHSVIVTTEEVTLCIEVRETCAFMYAWSCLGVIPSLCSIEVITFKGVMKVMVRLL
jgi:hypothetical protein